MAMNLATYNTGVCDCFDDGSSCFEAWCCPWCFVSQQYNMLTARQRGMNTAMCAGSLFCDLCFTGGLALFISSCIVRSTARAELQLTEQGACGDCCVVFWCRACSDCQVYRELSLRNMWPGGMCCVDKAFTKPGLQAPASAQMGGGSNQLPPQGSPYAQPQHAPYAGHPQHYPQQQGHYPQQGGYYPAQNQQQQAYGQPAPQGYYGQPQQGYPQQQQQQGYGQPPPQQYGYTQSPQGSHDPYYQQNNNGGKMAA